MNLRRMTMLLLVPLLLLAPSCANTKNAHVAATSATSLATSRPTIHATTELPKPLHIHLPGIGGYRGVDRGMLRGLREGGYDARIEPLDWPGEEAGLVALTASKRHREQAARIAEMIVAAARQHPGVPITVSAHSAGSGIIAWALEQLPDGVQIDRLLFVAPALSPQYDLSRALAHVRDKAYVFYSPYDSAVLGIGTKMFGTVDGVKGEASGKLGFTPPPSADQRQYEKLVQVPYRSEWIKLGNIGDHIGGMSRPFSRAVLAPLLAHGGLPPAPAATPQEPLALPPPLPTSAPAPSPAAPSPAAPAPAPATTAAPAEAGR